MKRLDYHALPDTITVREEQILAYSVDDDYTCQEIADKMNISLETVKRHRKNILKKFGVKGKRSFRDLVKTFRTLIKAGFS